MRLSKLKYKHKNQMEERNKPAEKMQRKLMKAGAVRESTSVGGNHTANCHLEKNIPVRMLEDRVLVRLW